MIFIYLKKLNFSVQFVFVDILLAFYPLLLFMSDTELRRFLIIFGKSDGIEYKPGPG